MRPEQFSSGNLYDLLEIVVIARIASMRPEQFSSGNHDGRLYAQAAVLTASMRPEQFSSGNPGRCIDRGMTQLCSFNEAGAIQLRKSRTYCMTKRARSNRFNEAGAIQLRKSAIDLVDLVDD